MESKYAHIADIILHRRADKTSHSGTNADADTNNRFLVAVAGIPGSGKTTTAQAVARYINNNTEPSNHKTTILSMDGFHLPRATLDKLPNREEAYARRGAPWTFDVDRFLQFMRRLRAWADSGETTNATAASTSKPEPKPRPASFAYESSNQSSTSTPTPSQTERGQEEKQEDVIYAPTFDHSAKDPIENSLKITPDISIVIIEGNYLLLDEPGWRDIAGLVDYKIFVDTDLQEARRRVARRHVQAGIEKTLDDGFRRVDRNDYLNGILVKEKLIPADLVIQSHDTHFVAGV